MAPTTNYDMQDLDSRPLIHHHTFLYQWELAQECKKLYKQRLLSLNMVHEGKHSVPITMYSTHTFPQSFTTNSLSI